MQQRLPAAEVQEIGLQEVERIGNRMKEFRAWLRSFTPEMMSRSKLKPEFL